MNTLRSPVLLRQAPLRAEYAKHPEQGLIHKHVHTEQRAETDAFHGTVVPVEPYGITWRYGVDRAVGGFHDAPNPGEILCAALAACFDSTVRMLAEMMGVAIERLEVEVIGDVDVRGALVVDPEVPVGFQAIACKVRLQPAAGTPPARVKKLVDQAELLCITLQTLRNGVPVQVSCETEAATAATAA